MRDALAMATGMAWLCWQFVILPAAEGRRFGLETLVGSFYPLGDVVLFAAVAILILAPGTKRGATLYLAAALVVTLVGDVAISMLPQIFPDLSRAVQADRLDGVLLVANSFFVAAVVHRDAARIAEPDDLLDQRLHPARVVFLGIALVALPMFAGLQTFDSMISRVSLLTSIAVLTSLILVRFVLVVREQEYTRAVLAHRAQHDQLTGLANRQVLQTRLDRALTRARSRTEAYGPVIFYLDLNGFKQINDRHGHASGDYVLVEFARRLRSGLRAGDTAARLGGDEFVVLTEDVDNEAEAQAIAERLRGLTDEPGWRSDECFTIGVSIGVAAAGDLADPDADALLAAADSEMYAEKSSRRDHREIGGRHRTDPVPAPATV
jgi:diguanylate cyclase (GGDEF)-like protein